MIAKIETFVWLDEDSAEEDSSRVFLAIGDALLKEGFGNVADLDPAKTKLTSVNILHEAGDGDWKRSVQEETARGFDLPTDDEKFVAQADAGDIEVMSL